MVRVVEWLLVAALVGGCADPYRPQQYEAIAQPYRMLAQAYPSPLLSEEIPLQRLGDTYRVPVRINGTITLPFVLDSGASDLSIPADVALTLIRAGALGPEDFIGKAHYQLANGSEMLGDRILLREVRVGRFAARHITATVGPAQSQPLLGQSFLSKFASWSLDNSKRALVLTARTEAASVPAGAVGAADGLAAGYGAIAWDRATGKYGWASNQPNPPQATLTALGNCGTRRCRIIIHTAARQCAALATSPDGMYVGAAARDTLDAARMRALTDCQKQNPGVCVIRAGDCNK